MGLVEIPGSATFTPSSGEIYVFDLIGLVSEVGLDECEPENKIRKYAVNGERYYRLITAYTGQKRLAVGCLGRLAIHFDMSKIPDTEVGAIVTRTTILCGFQKNIWHDEETQLFNDELPKLIHDFTVVTQRG